MFFRACGEELPSQNPSLSVKRDNIVSSDMREIGLLS